MKRDSLHACHFGRLVGMPRKPILYGSISAYTCSKALKSRSKMLMLDVNFRDGTKRGLWNSQLRWNPYIMTSCSYAISSCKRNMEGGAWTRGVCLGTEGAPVPMLTKANTAFVRLSLYFGSCASQVEICRMDSCITRKIVVSRCVEILSSKILIFYMFL